MEELKKLVRPEYLIALIGFGVSMISWYFSNNQTNQLQNENLTQVFKILENNENRITAIEHKQNTNDTQMAVIKVQLDAIQSDLKDIKAELKKK